MKALQAFRVMRREDVSGNTGTGHVADAVRFPNGKAAIAFREGARSVALYDSLEDLIATHGHDGRTVLEPVAVEPA